MGIYLRVRIVEERDESRCGACIELKLERHGPINEIATVNVAKIVVEHVGKRTHRVDEARTAYVITIETILVTSWVCGDAVEHELF